MATRGHKSPGVPEFTLSQGCLLGLCPRVAACGEADAVDSLRVRAVVDATPSKKVFKVRRG